MSMPQTKEKPAAHEAKEQETTDTPDNGDQSEPKPDPNVKVPKYQYLTEGFDPDQINKR